MLAFTSTCGRKLYSHLHSQMSRHSLRSALCFRKATHASVVLRSMLVLLRGQYQVQLPVALARLLGFANPRCSRPFGVICFANYATHKLASQLACSQNTTDRVPKNVFEENFLGCTHRALPFFFVPKVSTYQTSQLL